MKTVTLKLGNAFIVRVNKKLVDIETPEKDWKMQFGAHTKEYAQIMYIIEQKDEEALQTLCVRLFFTRLIVQDKDFLQMYSEMCGEYFKLKGRDAAEVSKEDDDKILQEEKALHEYGQ